MGLPGGDLWWRNVELLRRVPVAAGIMGSVAGAPAAFALMSHFTVMIKEQSQIFPSRSARSPPRHRRDAGQRGARRLPDARPRQRTGGQRSRE